jgi:hypothetical protein
VSTQTWTAFLLLLLVLEQGCRAAPDATPAVRLGGVCSGGPCPTTEQRFLYKGRTIVIDEHVDPPKVTIDGTSVVVYVLPNQPQGKKYLTPNNRHQDYSTLLELAKSLIDTGMLFGPGTSSH